MLFNSRLNGFLFALQKLVNAYAEGLSEEGKQRSTLAGTVGCTARETPSREALGLGLRPRPRVEQGIPVWRGQVGQGSRARGLGRALLG